MKKIYFGIIIVLLAFCLNVNADIKCNEGKPGDTVSCTVSGIEATGNIKRIQADSGLTFDSCNVCSGNTYNLTKDKAATFNFKIDNSITESKKLNVTIANETGSINVNVSTTTTTTNPNEVTYTVTLVPGKNKSNITKSCTVNSLNDTCNVNLDNLDDDAFNGWSENKSCTEGSKGNIKVK